MRDNRTWRIRTSRVIECSPTPSPHTRIHPGAVLPELFLYKYHCEQQGVCRRRFVSMPAVRWQTYTLDPLIWFTAP